MLGMAPQEKGRFNLCHGILTNQHRLFTQFRDIFGFKTSGLGTMLGR